MRIEISSQLIHVDMMILFISLAGRISWFCSPKSTILRPNGLTTAFNPIVHEVFSER